MHCPLIKFYGLSCNRMARQCWPIGQNFVECSMFHLTFIGFDETVIGQISLFIFSLLFVDHDQSANLI